MIFFILDFHLVAVRSFKIYDFKTLSGLVYEYKKFIIFNKVILMIQASKISRK